MNDLDKLPNAPEAKQSSAIPSSWHIQTQIHRRKKAKAVPPLTDEWECSQVLPPKALRRLPEDMPTSSHPSSNSADLP